MDPGVEAVLATWRARITEILGDSLAGAYLFGSLPMGGYELRWSDIDVCTLLSDPLSDDQVTAIGLLHNELEARFLPTWPATQLVEGPYLPETLAGRPGSKDRCLLVGTGE